jgi:hypothetical protein
MKKIFDESVTRRSALISMTAGLAGAIAAVSEIGTSHADCGGGGGSEGGDPRVITAPTPKMTNEVRGKLKKIRDITKKAASEIKAGKRKPLTEAEKKYFMDLLGIYDKYKNTQEFQDALWAVFDLNTAR